MIDEKRLEQEYRKLQEQAAPDLWDRIEGKLKEHPERNAIEEIKPAVAEEAGRKKKKGQLWRRSWYGLATAAAVITVTFGVNLVRNSNQATSGMEVGPAEMAAADAGKTLATFAPGVVTWRQLSVPAYTALSVPEQAKTVPEDAWYFSEDILADTELLCEAKVHGVSLEYDDSGNAGKVVYEMTIDEVYYAEDYVSSAELIQVKSPIICSDGDEAYLLYQLQVDGGYLLPLKKQEGSWELLFPFAPQVQILKQGGYLFHSGYASLVDNDTSVVVGQQEAANDYYYDRMLLRTDNSFLSDFLTLVEHKVQGRS